MDGFITMGGRRFGNYGSPTATVTVVKKSNCVNVCFVYADGQTESLSFGVGGNIANHLAKVLASVSQSNEGYVESFNFSEDSLTCVTHAVERMVIGKVEEKLCAILLDERIPLDVCDAETGSVLVAANRKMTRTRIRAVAERFDSLYIEPSPIQLKVKEVIDDAINQCAA